jgi:hypothetical protein
MLDKRMAVNAVSRTVQTDKATTKGSGTAQNRSPINLSITACDGKLT